MSSPATDVFLAPAPAPTVGACQFLREMDAIYGTPTHSPLHHDMRCTSCRPHSCRTQCDSCHDVDNCVPATRQYDEHLLCKDCYDAAVYLDGYPEPIRYFED